MGYKPIESYGVIGDLHSVALVGMDGSIDWCCLPRFDSPSLFAAILDENKGGYFRVSATSETCRQMYLPETNCLVTRFLSPDGVGEVVDFMPVGAVRGGGGHLHQIVRIARCVRGTVSFRAPSVFRPSTTRATSMKPALWTTAWCSKRKRCAWECSPIVRCELRRTAPSRRWN